MALKPLNEFRYMSFDVVGTLIDFEGGLVGSLTEIGRDHGVEVDADRALDLYRSARYMPDVGHFPDDLVRVYKVIAADLGLPATDELGQRLRDAVPSWKAFPDAAAAMAKLKTKYRLIAMTNAQ